MASTGRILVLLTVRSPRRTALKRKISDLIVNVNKQQTRKTLNTKIIYAVSGCVSWSEGKRFIPKYDRSLLARVYRSYPMLWLSSKQQRQPSSDVADHWVLMKGERLGKHRDKEVEDS